MSIAHNQKVAFFGTKQLSKRTFAQYLKVRNKTPPKSKMNYFKKVRGVLFEIFKNVSRILFSTQGSIGMVKTDNFFLKIEYISKGVSENCSTALKKHLSEVQVRHCNATTVRDMTLIFPSTCRSSRGEGPKLLTKSLYDLYFFL